MKAQATRSRSQNEKIARQLLAEKVEVLLKGDQSRAAIKAERARKKKASKTKKSHRKYRDVDARKQEDDGEEHDEDVEDSNGSANHVQPNVDSSPVDREQRSNSPTGLGRSHSDKL